jgi:hypothetical protein
MMFRWDAVTLSTATVGTAFHWYLVGWGVAVVLSSLAAFLAKQPDY